MVLLGDANVKKAKLRYYKGMFEQLKMNDEENISDYMLRMDEVVNSMKELGLEITENDICDKILRSLPNRFSENISTIEEAKDLDKFKKDELHSILKYFELRTKVFPNPRKEVAFKTTNKSKGKQQEESDKSSSDEEANHIKKASSQNTKV